MGLPLSHLQPSGNHGACRKTGWLIVLERAPQFCPPNEPDAYARPSPTPELEEIPVAARYLIKFQVPFIRPVYVAACCYLALPLLCFVVNRGQS